MNAGVAFRLSSSTNISVVKSGMTLALTWIDGDLWNPAVNVGGNISPYSGYTIWVNGVQGTNNGDGTWDATNVPVTAGGTASFDMRAYPPGYAPSGNSWTNFAVEDESYPNPRSSDAVDDNGNQDKQPAVYVKANKYNFTEFETPVKGGLTASVAVDQDWSQGGGGYWNENYYGPLGHGWQGSFQPDTWPADAGYLPVLSGQGYDYYSNSIPQSSVSTNAVNPNFEWIEVVSSASGSFTDDPYEGLFVQWAETAGQVVELFTGGKALRQDKSLFVLSQALSAEDFDTNYYEVEPVAAIPPTQITLGAVGNLDSTGNLYAALKNGRNVVVTPHAPAIWYGGALGGVQKYSVVHHTEQTALTNPDWNRTTVGVAEQVDLSFDPTPWFVFDWTTTAGGLSETPAANTTFTAPSNATPSVTVTATIRGSKSVKFPSFTVVEPNGYTGQIIGTNHYSPGLLGAGMTNLVYILPTDVSFYRVTLVELECYPMNITGYYTNQTIGSVQVGSAALSAGNSEHDQVFSGAFSPSFPIYSGGFDLYVTNYWQITGSSVSNFFAVIPSTVRILNSSGDTSVNKYGITMTRSTNDVSYSTQ